MQHLQPPTSPPHTHPHGTPSPPPPPPAPHRVQAAAEVVGKKIAEACLAKNISKVAFDRGGFKYHGRIKVDIRGGGARPGRACVRLLHATPCAAHVGAIEAAERQSECDEDKAQPPLAARVACRG